MSEIRPEAQGNHVFSLSNRIGHIDFKWSEGAFMRSSKSAVDKNQTFISGSVKLENRTSAGNPGKGDRLPRPRLHIGTLRIRKIRKECIDRSAGNGLRFP